MNGSSAGVANNTYAHTHHHESEVPPARETGLTYSQQSLAQNLIIQSSHTIKYLNKISPQNGNSNAPSFSQENEKVARPLKNHRYQSPMTFKKKDPPPSIIEISQRIKELNSGLIVKGGGLG